MYTVMALRPRGDLSTEWWVRALIMSVITVGTVFGNTAVLIALRRIRRSPTHYPLASLASADLMLGLFVLPIAAARDLFVFHLTCDCGDSWGGLFSTGFLWLMITIFSDWAFCSFWSTMDVLCCTASILSLCTLGWERWCGITYPLARARRARKAKIFAALVWPVSVCVALPTAFIPSPKHFIPGEIPKACEINTNIGYVFYSVTLSFYLPASVMVFLYSRILRALGSMPQIRAHRGGSPYRNTVSTAANAALASAICSCPSAQPNGLHRSKTMFQLSNSNSLHLPSSSPRAFSTPNKDCGSAGGIISRQRRATRTIVMLMALFLFCWTPFFVMLPIDSFCECVRDGAWQWCTWLGYTNSALNPLVYAAASPAVSRALQASLTSNTRSSDLPLTPQPTRK